MKSAKSSGIICNFAERLCKNVWTVRVRGRYITMTICYMSTYTEIQRNLHTKRVFITTDAKIVIFTITLTSRVPIHHKRRNKQIPHVSRETWDICFIYDKCVSTINAPAYPAF